MIQRVIHFVPILSAMIFVGLCVLLWPFVADDAFIVGRYALNAAEGQGLVFNPGEYITALTSPLHALLESLIALFHTDPVAIYRFIAPLFPLGGILIAARIVALPLSNRALFFAFALTSPFLALWTVGGLETPILAGLIAIYAALIVRIAQTGGAATSDFINLGIITGLAFVARFDSILVTMPPLLALALLYRRRVSLWFGAGVALVIALAWLGFSYAYYGEVVPTSAYVKLGAFSNSPLSSVYVTVNFLVVTGLFVLLPLVRLRSPVDDAARALFIASTISACLFLIYALQASGQHMMFGYRLFVPYLPAIALILAISANRWVPLLTAGVLTLNLGLAFMLSSQSINPSPITKLPGLNRVVAEYANVTPAEYGSFIEGLRQDALDLKAHWQATGRTETPAIFLFTGGTGYWLRDFHIFELLVNYRHACTDRRADMIGAADYVQDFGGIWFNAEHMELFMARPDTVTPVDFVSYNPLSFGVETYVRYAYGPDPGNFRFSENVNAPCE